MTRRLQRTASALAGTALVLASLAGCSGGGTSGSGDASSRTVTVTGDVPLVYVRRSTDVNMNPTNGAPFAPGGDLMLREKSSPSAPEHNLTAHLTLGKGDASDPEVSYDGTKVVFSLRCPAENAVQVEGRPACTGRWNLWEYAIPSSGRLHEGTFRRLTHGSDADDVDPAYLPAGRGFVFSSNRQGTSRARQALDRNYLALDEYERERVFNLHTMAADGSAITQISVNQSHDRNPVVRPNGDLLFSRWEHVAGRNRFSIFRARPDGTDLFVLYGAHSSGNSFLHPRDMDPAGAYKGQLVTSLMPLSGTQEGGPLMMVDAANYSEQNTPASPAAAAVGGQRQMTAQELSMNGGLSLFGHATTPYPLWDGTDRVLVAWRPCEVTRDGTVVPCASLTSAERERMASRRSRAEAEADPVQDDAPSAYAIYMFDPAAQTWLVVAAPPPGFMHTDPVALQPRSEPSVVDATTVDATLAARGVGIFEVRSVYDTDGLGRMGDAVLVPGDLAPGCAQAIAKTAPADPLDLRREVAHLARMKDPADPAYRCAPARFLRVTRAVAPPSASMGLRTDIGETEFEQQQILGYVPIEPDGSVRFEAPADVPLALAVVDAKGRAFQTHTNWLQLRPGERRTCDGCHSPRRGGSLNSGAVVNSVPAGWRAAMAGARQSGETMASTRTRLDPGALQLTSDPQASDIWADAGKPGVQPREALALRYRGNPGAGNDLVTAPPQRGIINYEQQIQPLWSRDRGAGTCIHCHGSGARFDLSDTINGNGRVTSYESLLIGPPVIDPATGQPQTRLEEGVPVIVRQAPLVDNNASEGDAVGIARKSRLVEILSGEVLKAGAAARTAHPTPTIDHTRWLNAAEQRLLAEWLDLGGQYFNDPFDASARSRSAARLTLAAYREQVHPVMVSQCRSCHQPRGSGEATTAAEAAGSHAPRNRLVLTGDAEGDFNVVLSMVRDTCNPANNLLLQRPSGAPHRVVLARGSAGYERVAGWIAGGCSR